MSTLMRCQFCGLLQDEPKGVKTCGRCGGELAFENAVVAGGSTYLQVQMELDQVSAPAGRNVDRYVVVTIRAPSAVPESERAQTHSGRPALAFSGVLDTSGSMGGDKIVQAKEAVSQAVRHLQENDSFSLVTFASGVNCAIEPVQVGAQIKKVVESLLAEIQAGGQTALCGGLILGIEKAAKAKQENRLVLLLSDGQANVGETDVEAVGRYAASARQQGVVVSTIGIGNDYNEVLMTDIASEGGGRFYHIVDSAKIPAYLTGELGEVANLAAKEAELHLVLPPGSALVPLSAAYPAHMEGNQAVVSIGVIPLDMEQEITLRLTLPAQPVGCKLSLEGRLDFISPAGNHLKAALNRVTVRFVEQGLFKPVDGLVFAVAERVLGQMKAESVLSISRAMSRSQMDGEEQARRRIHSLHEYATLLGEDRAAMEAEELSSNLEAMQSTPSTAKMVSDAAYRRLRARKDFK